MKKILPFFLLAIALVALSAPASVQAEERQTLKSKSGNKVQRGARQFFKKPKATPRPRTRILLNTNVYRYMDRDVIDHDRVSSPEIIFHTREGRIVPGHAFDY